MSAGKVAPREIGEVNSRSEVSRSILNVGVAYDDQSVNHVIILHGGERMMLKEGRWRVYDLVGGEDIKLRVASS